MDANKYDVYLLSEVVTRIEALLLFSIIMGFIVLIFVICQCAILAFSFHKQELKQTSIPLSGVIVKGSKKSDKKSSKSKKSTKPGSKSASKSGRKSSKCLKVGSAEALKLKKSDKKSGKKSDKMSGSKSTSAESTDKKGGVKALTSASKGKKVQLKTSQSNLDVTSNGTATETQIAHIPPQFPLARRNPANLNAPDTSTDQLIAEIPNQFGSPKTAKAKLSNEEVAKIVKQVASLMTAKGTGAQSEAEVNFSPKVPNQTVDVQPQQQAFAKPVVYQQQVSGGKPPIESVYFMENTRGDPAKANPAELNVANPSNVSNPNAVPLDGGPQQGQ